MPVVSGQKIRERVSWLMSLTLILTSATVAGAEEALASTELLLHTGAESCTLLCTGNDAVFLLCAAAVVGEDIDGTHIDIRGRSHLIDKIRGRSCDLKIVEFRESLEL